MGRSEPRRADWNIEAFRVKKLPLPWALAEEVLASAAEVEEAAGAGIYTVGDCLGQP